MLSCPKMDLATIEDEITRQSDLVAKSSSRQRYGELLRLQMLREMRDILQEAYRLRLESKNLLDELSSEFGAATA